MVLPASMRLRGHRCFDHLHRRGKRYHGTLMVLRKASSDSKLLRRDAISYLMHAQHQSCRIAVVISGKVHKRAVVRNRLRRLLHDHLRARFEARSEHSDCWLLISLRPGADAEEANLLEECDRLLEQAGLQP
ncbi:ribonuclease P protein component [Synechococcus sp. MEDNS5]|uniref:ribonuclease P protein component n=1 Tax=Synechococcus sp. MEDNS5 TaxID=1442554 RepID=UPI001646816C|nr:ribonuclease P protein component [Synechococcus sp. MEDNS5]QNJ06787.1 ribonuclease P protein component [Synechococcus sp. MEDNS5]